ncbi:isoleucine--tRNA ligase [Candidatus Woesearchaeota archaeon]|nr:isoleucine--tRNA ligase [Candidatus Woesearchaeota archaeon]
MRFEQYTPQELETEILSFWKKNKILEKLRKHNKKSPTFYFLEGPPYTSGHIHLGHAWNMALKDLVLRYKRMRGFDVWDRMGYDMHGLPTEQKTMARLNLKNKEEIEQFGVKKFTQECKKFCQEMMEKMNEDFIRLGSTLDFSNPYQPITREFMDAEWWLIKKAYEKNRLYQGLRTMHWDAATQTAVAKHELEYKSIKDTSIYVKFRDAMHPQTFFVVWTTTPWTIPLNLAVMVNPELDYVEARAGAENWIVAKSLAKAVLLKAGIDTVVVVKEYKGKKLEGRKYIHPLPIRQYLPLELQHNSRLFSVLLSSEYVDDSAGTGIVHCAPGCGPEDYEVGHLYHLPPFNCVNEAGFFANFGPFSGWKAKADDSKFIAAIKDAGALIAKEAYVHDYPYGERSHEPVIFRTTKQWFFKVEDLKEKMLAANAGISWHPQSGKNAFNSWLDNLRDNSITKQRYWGTPVPIWQAEDGDVIVVGSVAELEQLSGQKVKEMHIPQIDEITITRNGKLYTRVPDILDVWIDAGTVSWNCLDYPRNEATFNRLFPADFILEGKDQIRGWYNLLMVASFLAFDRPSFKAVYMHGFVTDVNGVKMSKSIGNIISPYEVIDKYGADVLRYYTCQTNAGEDINFSWEECVVKQRNLSILWNLHKLLLNLAEEMKYNPFAQKSAKKIKDFGPEEKYIFSRLHSTTKTVTELMESYRLDEVVAPLENLFLDVSRTYVQMVRDKSSIGTADEREVCAYTLGHVLLECLQLCHPVVPFISEAIFLNLKEAFKLKEESITHYSWPAVDEAVIDPVLEGQFDIVQSIITAGLAAREKAKLSLRWPVSEMIIGSEQKEIKHVVESLQNILRSQLNAKVVRTATAVRGMKQKVKPEYAKIGPAYGKLSTGIITRLTVESPETILKHLEKEGVYVFTVDSQEVRVTREMVSIETSVPEPYVAAESNVGLVYVNTERTPALEAEGFAREITRVIQNARKNAGLQKSDEIELVLSVRKELQSSLKPWTADIEEKVGAVAFDIVTADPVKTYEFIHDFSVKTEKMKIWLRKV